MTMQMHILSIFLLLFADVEQAGFALVSDALAIVVPIAPVSKALLLRAYSLLAVHLSLFLFSISFPTAIPIIIHDSAMCISSEKMRAFPWMTLPMWKSLS